MNEKRIKTRNCNGEGSTFYTVQKIKRKKFLDEECDICKNCTDRTACNNRIGWDKCDKCKNCKEICLKYCDRFYCRGIWQSQVTINGKQTTVANSNKRKESTEKKKEIESQLLTNNYIQKNNITILEMIKKIDKEKEKSGEIGGSTISSNQFKYKKIEDSILATLPIQKIDYTILQDFFNYLRDTGLSQSEINKYFNKFSNGFERAVLDRIISYPDNPILRIKRPISLKQKKLVQSFSLEEEKKLIKYLCSTPTLVHSYKCKYDNDTLRNLILLALFSLCRIGELGAIDYTQNIDFNKNNIIITRTLSKDSKSKIILGNTTKTGKKKIQAGKSDIRYVPFALFHKEIVEKILRNQIEVAKKYKNNTNNLLFLTTDGNYISHVQITTLFKRICREAEIKLNLSEGCHIHMTRHTGITRLIEFGMNLLTISTFSGHTDITQIQETYGHILDDFKNSQINNPNKNFSKDDLFTPDVIEALNKIYK